MTPDLELLYATLSLREFAIAALPEPIASHVREHRELDDPFLYRYLDEIRRLAQEPAAVTALWASRREEALRRYHLRYAFDAAVTLDAC